MSDSSLPCDSPARTTADQVVDALGQACPIPVIMLARAIGEVDEGAEVEVLADDPGAKVDIPVWCRMKQHQFLAMSTAERGWRFRVRRSH